MSRTFRHVPHWAPAHLEEAVREIMRGNTRAFNRWAPMALSRVRGDDGACCSAIGMADTSAPNGHSYRESHAKDGRKFHKRRTAKIMRRRHQKDVASLTREHFDFIALDEFEAMAAEARDAQYDDFYLDEERFWNDDYDKPDDEPDDYDPREDDSYVLDDSDPWESSAEEELRMHLMAEQEARYRRKADERLALRVDTNEGGKSLGEILADALRLRLRNLPVTHEVNSNWS